ncbi:hypothetical protein N8987_06710, partial [Crocinitomix sp.]|nr:hypothetical protein [Crocinitomix sp.]
MILFLKLWYHYRSIDYFYRKLFEIAKLTKILKGIGASIHILIELIILILILFAFFIRSSWFQTYLAQEIAGYLSNELQTEIRIDKVDIIFFDKVELEGIYVEDKIKDTLLYSESIRINVGGFSITDAFVEVQNLELNKSTINIRKYQNDSTFNFQHLVDYFASAEEDTTEAGPFRVGVEQVSLNDVNFRFQDQNEPKLAFGINYSDLNIQHLTGKFSDFNFEDNTISAHIEDLKFQEQSGLSLRKLTADVAYSPSEISLNKLELALNNSVLRADFLKLKTPNGAADFADFVNKVNFESKITNSVISLADISYFVPTIRGMNTMIHLNNIDLSGPVYGMLLSNTDITLLESTILRGNFQIPNLDQPETAEFDEEIVLFQTTIEDVERLKLTPFLEGEDYLRLPTTIRSADKIKYQKGLFKGTLTDFLVKGEFTSGIGNIYAVNGIKFKMDSVTEIYSYSSVHSAINSKDIVINELDLGAISGNTMLGKTTGYLSVNEGSKGFSTNDLKVLFSGRFESLTLNDYTYHNILIKQGEFSNNVFDGKIDIEDDNLALSYDGWMDLKNEMTFEFDIRVDSAKLAKLNFREDGVVDRFKSSKISVKIKGNSLQKSTGSVFVENLDYQDSSIGADIQLDSLSLFINRTDSLDIVQVHSDFIDVDLSGKFDLTDMWPVIQHQLVRVADHLIPDVDISQSKNKYFDLTINLKDINPFMPYIDTALYIAKGTTIKSTYNLAQLKLNINVNSDLITYGDMRFKDIQLNNSFDSVRASTQYEVGEIYVQDSLGVRYAAIYSYVKDNKFSTNLGWDALGNVEPALFAFTTSIDEDRNILTEFNPSFFYLKSQKWDINKTSKILFNKEIVDFTDFRIANKNHFIDISGRMSNDPSDWLYFQVRDFDMAYLNGVLGEGLGLGGILNVEGGVADVYNNIRFMALSEIDNLIVQGEKVGDVLIDNKWNKDNNSFEMSGNL